MRISARKGTARVGFGRERKDENRFFSFPWRRRKTIARREEEWTEVALLLAFGVLVCRACVFLHSSERGTEKCTRAAGTELENEMHQQRERESATAVFFLGGGVNWGLRRRKISAKNVDDCSSSPFLSLVLLASPPTRMKPKPRARPTRPQDFICHSFPIQNDALAS